MDGHNLELLWRRLDDAKLQLDRCHRSVRQITDDRISGALPSPDGNYAHVRGLRAEEVAIQDYLHALEAFKEELLAAPQPAEVSGDAALTLREREVLALVASGKSSRAIAKELGISFKTVTTHRYRLLRKLNVHNTADLTRIAMKMGLVGP